MRWFEFRTLAVNTPQTFPFDIIFKLHPFPCYSRARRYDCKPAAALASNTSCAQWEETLTIGQFYDVAGIGLGIGHSPSTPHKHSHEISSSTCIPTPVVPEHVVRTQACCRPCTKQELLQPTEGAANNGLSRYLTSANAPFHCDNHISSDIRGDW